WKGPRMERGPFSYLDSKIARPDSDRAQSRNLKFARKNFFAFSFWGLRSCKVQLGPRVAASHQCDTPDQWRGFAH
ncbi:hypothetical protein K3179_06225, partial [Qipengyuania sp. GH38]|uniref:hypothetical protein n=1 Tax=Qipengyuania intermedia TaxID=2867244 RepID=UPI001C880149